MDKRSNQYKLELHEVAQKDGTPGSQVIELEFNNHDSIFELLALVQANPRFETPGQDARFLLGLKLFSEVMLNNRRHPLFEEFAPAFTEFMKKYKSFGQQVHS
ncbi:MAG: DUF3861 family protein [Chitinophagaceae bacterium]|nr:MAG: DUF3861 family protein [Chitinophagaceae bacterium]